MSQVIEIELPDSVHEVLKDKAKNSGLSTEALVTQLLKDLAKDLENDPLEKYIGAFDSQKSDWIEHHDDYIGNSVADSIDSENR